MKKIFFVLLGFAFATAQAQTVDDIIQKNAAAMGGLDNINKIKTAKMSGNVTIQGQDFGITIQVVNNTAFRSDAEIMGSTVTNVYNNGKGWKVNAFAGASTPTEVTGSELNDFRNQAMLANQLIDYKNRGHKVELAGQEDVDGVKAFKILLTNKDDGKVTTYFISTVNSMLLKSVSKREIQGAEYDVETYYSDYKDYNGLKFSMTRTQKIEGQVFQEVKLTTVELNVPIDNKIFDMPK